MDFGRVLGGLAGDFGDILVHVWNSKNLWFPLVFKFFGVFRSSRGRWDSWRLCWAMFGARHNNETFSYKLNFETRLDGHLGAR